MRSLSVYIHWPYCVSKCPYCDFNSAVAKDAVDFERWARSYEAEINAYAALLPEREVVSVYFGGGTPSLMSPRVAEGVLNAVAKGWRMADDAEITLEANPSSAEAEKFAAFRAAGINRLSLGVQSLRDDTLRFLGRAHDANEARGAIALAAKHFPRYSFDLIYGIRGQTPQAWQEELAESLAFGAKHMSLYQLTIEKHTRFKALSDGGEILTSDEDAAAEMYEATAGIMAEAGLPLYEISNYAAASEQSRHNLQYWKYRDYLGIGPGAHGRFAAEKNGKNPARTATENHRAPDAWMDAVSRCGHGSKTREEISPDAAMLEALLMGLRLREGLCASEWREEHSCELVGGFLSREKVSRMRDEGWLEWDDGEGGRDTASRRLRTTLAGTLRLDAVIAELTRGGR